MASPRADALHRILFTGHPPNSRIAILSLFSLTSCDPGSAIAIDPQTQNRQVYMQSRPNGLAVAMTLACDANGANCYEITPSPARAWTSPLFCPSI